MTVVINGTTGIDTVQDSVITSAKLASGQTLSVNGITFPASQVASADANTLDDYEEGTWTPTILFGGSGTGITYAVQLGRYTKIGRIVSLQCNVVLSNKGSAAGDANISNLPFAGQAPSRPLQVGWVVAESGASSWTQATYGLVWNDARVYIRYNNGTTLQAITNGNFTNSTEIYFSCTYEIN
jgi:hypothetical protein